MCFSSNNQDQFGVAYGDVHIINLNWMFLNRGNTEGTNSLKILCLMFVYVLFYVL